MAPLDLEVVRAEIVVCTRCRLAPTRKRAVPGEGPTDAPVVFVGEAPGGRENETGRPFVGPAGELLEQLLAGIGWKRSDVFITNIVKCWPPGNRDPLPDEKTACNGYLDRQIFALRPRIIATLGRHSLEKFFGPGQSISRIHGTTTRWRGIICYALYHPAAALHQPSLKQVLVDDFARLPVLLQAAGAELLRDQPGAPTLAPAENQVDGGDQLRLF